MQDEAGKSNGLDNQVLGPLEIFGQSVGNTGMATVVAIAPVLVAESAGNGSWLSMLIALVGVLGVGYCVALFGRRVATSGSLYTYAARSLGRAPAFLTGWALLIAYVGLAVAMPMIGAQFVGEVIGEGTAVQIVLWFVFAAVATGMAYFGARVSTRAALLLEAFSIALLGVVLVATVVKAGTVIDSAQLHLKGVSVHDLFLGITLSVTAFVGFESGASLGAEARDPHRAIPRVILLTIGLAGVIYMLSFYVETLGYHHLNENIATADAPTAVLGDWVGLGFLKYPIALGLGFSFFAVMLASVNALSRMLYTMAREGVAPAAFGRTHPVRRTPHVGILTIAPFLFVVSLIMKYVANASPVEVFSYIATPATFGFIFAYVLVAVGAVVLLYRERRRIRLGVLTAATVGVAAMIATYVANLTPVPPYPFNILPYVFLGLMVVGGLVFLALRFGRPESVRRVGTVDEESLDRELATPPAMTVSA
ncbi:Putrescine transporter PotE [Baekduia alba]|nr:Putrescine transporter PotE [Baekduia alba]